MDVYAAAYRYLPAAYGAFYEITQNETVTDLGLKFFSARKRREISKFLATTKPDLCICTYSLFLPLLTDFKAHSGTPVINIITDPWTYHPSMISAQVDAQLGFDDRTLVQAQKLAPQVKNEAIGWMVRPDFTPLKTSQTALRKSLGLEDMFTLFVSGGSEGSAMILKLAPTLIQPPKPIQVVITSGHNQQLHHLTKQLNGLFKRLQGKVKLITLPFTPNLAPYIQAADLVVGKAGPNTLFETIAIHKPFVAISHIPGQEDGNLDLIKKYQLGYVEENPMKLQKLLHRLIKRPLQLEKLQPKIKELADFNRSAQDKLLQVVEKLLKKN